jgi:Tn3 transposase DDE domain
MSGAGWSASHILQRVLDDPEWADRLTLDDRRALSPLFWSHVNPYGRFTLDMDSRLDLGAAGPQDQQSGGAIELVGVRVPDDSVAIWEGVLRP